MKERLEFSKKIRSNKGSITSFTLLSMLFFLVVVIAIYTSVNIKIQKQQKELNKIQKNYEQIKIDDIYKRTLNVDKTAPKLEIKTTKTTKSITVTAISEDEDSGIYGYRFSKDNGKTWTEYQESAEYTFDDLYGDLGGTTHNIKVQVKDNAGNVNEVSKTEKTSTDTKYFTNTKNDLLCTIAGRNYYKNDSTNAIVGMIYWTGTTGNKWTSPFLVSTSIEGVKYYTTYDYEIKTEGIGEITYGGEKYYYSSIEYAMPDISFSSKFPLVSNNRWDYYDVNNIVVKELLRLYYNNEKPNLSITTNTISNNITIAANVQSTGIPIKKILYSNSNGKTYNFDENDSLKNNYTFSNLETGKKYIIKVIVEDDVGNVQMVSKEIEI